MASNKVEDPWQFNKDVCQRNEHMLDNKLAMDVFFKVSSSLQGEARTIGAHTYVLISASPVFWAMFCGDMREIGDVIVTDVEPVAFQLMLRYIYTDKITLTENEVMHVLYAASKYQLPSLAQLCVKFLQTKLNTNNACSVFEHSIFFNEENLADTSRRVIEEHTELVINSDDFFTISKETLATILDSKWLRIDELKLFERCYEWGKMRANDQQSIREAMGDSVHKIRYLSMTMKDFTEVVCSKNVLTESEQLEVFKCHVSPEGAHVPLWLNCAPRVQDKGPGRACLTFRHIVTNIRNLSDLSISQAHYARNLPWKIMCTKKQNHYSQMFLSFFLQCNTDSNSTSWSCNAKANLRLLNSNSNKKPFALDTHHLFFHKENDWGFNHFIPWDVLVNPEEGYIKDDSITLEVSLTADEPQLS